ncbi:hypothetical protein [Methanosarcina sp. DH1]|uniref:hypothetical protein n=1 Tax=Methanosarcina sp. DH1 TaxID=2605695 RepID=UPI001E430A57|nr:hypothetical protein [Methanosarcina sp. DH1]
MNYLSLNSSPFGSVLREQLSWFIPFSFENKSPDPSPRSAGVRKQYKIYKRDIFESYYASGFPWLNVPNPFGYSLHCSGAAFLVL